MTTYEGAAIPFTAGSRSTLRGRYRHGNISRVQALDARALVLVLYNLTGAEAHTFFMGHGQWLVHNTNCQAIVNGKTYVAINSGAPESAVSMVQSIAKTNGWNFIYNPSLTQGAGHAEQVLYNGTNQLATSIGVSHRLGPCPQFCQPYFNGTGVELTYTGKTK